jgi:hypothetical protein
MRDCLAQVKNDGGATMKLSLASCVPAMPLSNYLYLVAAQHTTLEDFLG